MSPLIELKSQGITRYTLPYESLIGNNTRKFLGETSGLDLYLHRAKIWAGIGDERRP